MFRKMSDSWTHTFNGAIISTKFKVVLVRIESGYVSAKVYRLLSGILASEVVATIEKVMDYGPRSYTKRPFYRAVFMDGTRSEWFKTIADATYAVSNKAINVAVRGR